MPTTVSKIATCLALLLVSFAFTACNTEAKSDAQAAKSVDQKSDAPVEVTGELATAISNKFSAARPDLKVVRVMSTEVDNIYQVFFDGKGSVYVVGNGDFFFVGDLYQIDGSRLVNVTEQAANGPRAELLSSISREDMIIFSPKGEVKASVIVFTDVDCGYCRKLHQEVPRMNELGIEIKYLAYPRAGVGSKSYDKIASAWCADDRQEAMNELKAGRNISINVCEGNPVAKQFDIGIQAGLSGTPAIVLETGELIPGYMPAERLAQTLGI